MSSQSHGAAGKPAELHAWLQVLIDESPVAIGLSRDGVMLDANPTYVRLFGYASAAELAGRSILEQIAPSHRAQIIEMVAQRARGESPPERYVSRGMRQDGTEFPFDVTTRRVVLADGPITIAFITDVSERDGALAALRASEERFRTLSSAAFEGVFVHADGTIILANDAGAAMYGFEPGEMVGQSVMDLTAPESRAVVVEHVKRGATEPYEGVARRKDGSTFVAEVRGRTLVHQGRPARVAIIRDVTDRRRAESEQRALGERVRQAQKLESLGVLAGGVAHDFNNILTVIANGAALAKRDPALSAATASNLDAIALATERAADLCRQMLAYTGKTALAREAVDVGALVAEMSSMLEVSIAKRVTLVRELAPGLPTILGDATQIRQVVMNLVLNASEAIAGSAGTVRVSTGRGAYGAEAFARSAAGGEPKAGDYVWIEIRDDGVGMDASTIAQMFDPFFTTKFVGRGLGMAAVLGIVRGHAGAIDVESTPGAGTRIRVLFPASEAKTRLATPRPAAESRGQGVVLLVDDERSVRASTQLLLEGFGFEVVAARDGVEAVEALRARRGGVDAALVDLTMPRMDGVETTKELRRIVPGLPVVLTSGYGAAHLEGSQDGAGQGGSPDAVLAKPYTARQLLAALEGVIRAR
jgi:two-component system cell cycle sensor histidine kinase/response regulator CckA